MNNNSEKKICLKMPDGDYHTSYVELADHPHKIQPGVIARSVSVSSVIKVYNGPEIKIDFNAQNIAIGLEILYSYADED